MMKARFSSMAICMLLFVFSLWLFISASAQTGNQTNGAGGKAAVAGDPRAKEILAREQYEKAAAAGDAEAMYNLGLSYKEGRMIGVDYALARKWFAKAAAAGNT